MKISSEDGSLIWDDDKGFGFHTRKPISYETDYFTKYIDLDQTYIGYELTVERISFVERHTNNKPVDIGIGGGIFCKQKDCYGYDVNKSAVEWLIKEKRYKDPYSTHYDCMTFWDSLEHISQPEKLLAMCRGWVFVSLPIFEDKEDCLNSKHYKPGEHIWYFTHDGFIAWMCSQGFKLHEYNNKETMLGREGIMSYAFRR